jgi:phage gp36-like protein
MAKTPVSSTSLYVTPADVLQRTDNRLIGDLCADAANPVRVAPADLPTNTTFVTAITDANGKFEAAALHDDRYTAADLQALMATPSLAASLVRQMVAALAILSLRGNRDMPGDDLSPREKEAVEWLDKIRDGQVILPFQESEDASLPVVSPLTSFDLERRTPALVSNLKRYFGDRLDRRTGP